MMTVNMRKLDAMTIEKLQSGAAEIFRQGNAVLTEAGNSVKAAEIPENKEAGPADQISISEIWASVARNIDVRDASPRQIISLSRQLYDEGAISYDDHLNLSFQPELDPDSLKESKAFSHEKRDYVALWQGREKNALRFGGGRAEIEETQRIQAILTYVDSLR